MTKLHSTRNSVPEASREKLVGLLNELLATGIHLGLEAKQAHWNIHGPRFKEIHELFDEVSTQSRDWSDTIAERAVQLGGIADGTLKGISGRTELRASDGTRDEGKLLAHIADQMGVLGKNLQMGIGNSEELKDPVTADILTSILGELDKTMWMVEAHLQS